MHEKILTSIKIATNKIEIIQITSQPDKKKKIIDYVKLIDDMKQYDKLIGTTSVVLNDIHIDIKWYNHFDH